MNRERNFEPARYPDVAIGQKYRVVQVLGDIQIVRGPFEIVSLGTRMVLADPIDPNSPGNKVKPALEQFIRYGQDRHGRLRFERVVE